MAVDLATPAETPPPASNDEGVALAMKQWLALTVTQYKDWTYSYDKHVDTFSCRKPGNRPAISYFVPGEPRVLLRLDPRTSEFVGVDFESLDRYLSKHYVAFKHLLRIWQVTQLIGRIPAIRGHLDWLLTIVVGSRSQAEQQVREATLSMCRAA